jgi:hypothetical protein
MHGTSNWIMLGFGAGMLLGGTWRMFHGARHASFARSIGQTTGSKEWSELSPNCHSIDLDVSPENLVLPFSSLIPACDVMR